MQKAAYCISRCGFYSVFRRFLLLAQAMCRLNRLVFRLLRLHTKYGRICGRMIFISMTTPLLSVIVNQCV